MLRFLPLALTFTALVMGQDAGRRAGRPNFVVILADDMGFGDSSVYDGWLKTPSLERLARGGLTFTDFHTSGTVCSPTRAGLLTGRYQQRVGVPGVVNADPAHPAHEHGLSPREFTVAELLRDAGYGTALFGKWHLGYAPRFNPLHHGFDVFRGFLSGNIDYVSHYDRMETYDWWDGLETVEEPGYLTKLITKHSVAYIEANRERPFFLYVSHGAVHSPIQGPDSPAVRGPERERPERGNRNARVRAMMGALDDGVGEILDALRRTGIEEETFVIFLSDNGGAPHMRCDPLRGRKGTPWEGGHRVPAIMRWEGRIGGGGKTEALCSSLDLMPTMLSLAGATMPEGRATDGLDLRAVLSDPVAGVAGSIELSDSEPRVEERKLYWDRAMRHGTWKLVHRKRGAALFDLSKDLGEKTDVAAQHPERVAAMKQDWRRWKDDVSPAKTPHVVFILADDMGYGDLGCNGPGAKTHTPCLDRLAAGGMRFTDAHAPGAVCVPTRYGIMTGRYPFRWKGKGIAADRLTLPEMLRGRGYRTAMVGKWHLGFPAWKRGDWASPMVGGPLDRGFDSYFGIPASLDIPPYYYVRGRRSVAPPTGRIEANGTEGWTKIQGAFWRAGGIAPGFDHAEVLPRLIDESVSVIRSHAEQGQERPLFLYLALPAPHTPWLPDEASRGKSDAGMYGDFVYQVDRGIGDVLAALERHGMADDTLVVFSSDNGPVWYSQDVEKYGHRSTGPFRGMKADAWEGGHRVPFLVRWPGTIAPGTVNDGLICQTDLMATFAAVTGSDLPANAAEDSVNLLPTLLRRKGAVGRTTLVHKRNASAIREGKWKLIVHLGSGGFSSPRRVKPTEGGPVGQLYDLESDPGETTNLWAQHPDVVERLRKRLREIKASPRSAAR